MINRRNGWWSTSATVALKKAELQDTFSGRFKALFLENCKEGGSQV
ncbi:MAG: hypothetical protein ACOX7Y_07685 [Methanosarcina sp.]